MIVRTSQEFLKQLENRDWPAGSPATPHAVMMVEPANFSVSAESAVDNLYMNLNDKVDAQLALNQSRDLASLLAEQGIEVVSFPGEAMTPDAIFPNNVFACTPDKLIIGHMLHPGRQAEAEREDIRSYFQAQGYACIDLSQKNCVAELTGVLNIDHARQIGFCGMTGRVDEAGLVAMHEAFDLNMIFSFELQAEEYHTNVIMMVLAGRACVIYPDAFVDQRVPEAIAVAFPGRTLLLSKAEKDAFAGNCIALTQSDIFMSQTGVDALRPTSRDALESWGFTIHAARLDEIEKAGGSLRCMLAEIF